MSEAQFSVFLSIGTWVCSVGAALNLLRLKRRGGSALILSAAFLAMGAVLWLIKKHAAQDLITLAGLAVAGLLIADFAVRSRGREQER